jgi:hypothetical protein
MNAVKISLLVYAWLVVAGLLFFLGRIAYFYERTSKQRVGYYFLLLPAGLLLAGAGWYIFHDVEFVTSPQGDLLLFGGGLLLSLFGFRLQELMTGER